MRKPRFKNAALNWKFSSNEYEEFSRDKWPIIDKTPGFLTRLEAYFLYQTAKNLPGASRDVDQPPATSVVEIGSHKGKSTVAIGMGIKENTHVPLRLVCVDPFFDTGRDKNLKNEFLSTITRAGLQDIVVCISDYSGNAVKQWKPDQGISLLWIDGNHEFEFVRDDFLSWSRYLVPGGLVAFHDWYLLGVRGALDQYLFPNKCYKNISVINYNLVAAQKTDSMPTWKDRAQKKRIYWALKTNSTNPFMALLGMGVEWMTRPFGCIRAFFLDTLCVQEDK